MGAPQPRDGRTSHHRGRPPPGGVGGRALPKGLSAVLSTNEIDDVIRRALIEDAPHGDITSNSLIPDTARATAVMVSRSAGVMAGALVVERAFPSCTVTALVDDGMAF